MTTNKATHKFSIGDKVDHKHNGMKGGTVTVSERTGVSGDTSARVVHVEWPAPWGHLGGWQLAEKIIKE